MMVTEQYYFLHYDSRCSQITGITYKTI